MESIMSIAHEIVRVVEPINMHACLRDFFKILFCFGLVNGKFYSKKDKYNTTGAVKKRCCLNSYGVELSSSLKQSLRRI